MESEKTMVQLPKVTMAQYVDLTTIMKEGMLHLRKIAMDAREPTLRRMESLLDDIKKRSIQL